MERSQGSSKSQTGHFSEKLCHTEDHWKGYGTSVFPFCAIKVTSPSSIGYFVIGAVLEFRNGKNKTGPRGI
jgi:hypothetical protein